MLFADCDVDDVTLTQAAEAAERSFFQEQSMNLGGDGEINLKPVPKSELATKFGEQVSSCYM